MKRQTAWMLLAAAALTAPGTAAEPAAESPTFAQLLRRVARRDPSASGRIETLRAREDAPGSGMLLSLELRKADNGRAVDVIAVSYSKLGDTLFERYLLKTEPRLEAELRKYEQGRVTRYLRATEVTRVKQGGQTVFRVPQARRAGPTPPPLPERSESAGEPLPLLGEEAVPGTRPSSTFADVLARASDREPSTGALFGVRSRADAPLAGVRLNFSLEIQKGQAIVTLTRPWKDRIDVYEQYRLKLTPEIQAEAAKLRRYEQSRQQAAEARKAEIVRLTGGKLRHGMKVEEVERIMGPGRRGEPHQAAGSLTLAYPSVVLHFAGFQLVWVEKTDESAGR